ncbi:DUF3618 domain-containing protein [Melissospora conviva]|uniref:DUF3618 domain-containing protein n=1 Tax=Melissospora conviva TaxID=3388432 RepID=UPI003C1E1161
MTVNGNGKAEANPEFLRREILRTRRELAQTVEALAVRADVKSRVKESTDQAKARMRAQAEYAKARMRIGAAHARSRVTAGVEQARSQVRTVGGSGTGPEGSRRSLAYKAGGGTDREARQLAVLAAGALAAVIVLLVVRRRRG